MSGYLSRLVARTLSPAGLVRPRLGSLFGPPTRDAVGQASTELLFRHDHDKDDAKASQTVGDAFLSTELPSREPSVGPVIVGPASAAMPSPPLVSNEPPPIVAKEPAVTAVLVRKESSSEEPAPSQQAGLTTPPKPSRPDRSNQEPMPDDSSLIPPTASQAVSAQALGPVAGREPPASFQPDSRRATVERRSTERGQPSAPAQPMLRDRPNELKASTARISHGKDHPPQVAVRVDGGAPSELPVHDAAARLSSEKRSQAAAELQVQRDLAPSGEAGAMPVTPVGRVIVDAPRVPTDRVIRAGPEVVGFGRRASQTPATIQVTIGHIEVRATVPPEIAKAPRGVSPAMSLEEYLRRRSGGGRR